MIPLATTYAPSEKGMHDDGPTNPNVNPPWQEGQESLLTVYGYHNSDTNNF